MKAYGLDDLGSVSLCWSDDLVRLGQYQEEITARIKKSVKRRWCDMWLAFLIVFAILIAWAHGDR